MRLCWSANSIAFSQKTPLAHGLRNAAHREEFVAITSGAANKFLMVGNILFFCSVRVEPVETIFILND
jgi:hypothetical protein